MTPTCSSGRSRLISSIICLAVTLRFYPACSTRATRQISAALIAGAHAARVLAMAPLADHVLCTAAIRSRCCRKTLRFNKYVAIAAARFLVHYLFSLRERRTDRYPFQGAQDQYRSALVRHLCRDRRRAGSGALVFPSRRRRRNGREEHFGLRHESERRHLRTRRPVRFAQPAAGDARLRI